MAQYRLAYCEVELIAPLVERAPWERLGVEVVRLPSPDALVALLRRETIHVCVLGADRASLLAIRALSDTPAATRPKVIVGLSQIDREMLQQLLEAKVDEWMLVPCPLKAFVQTVMDTLGHRGRRELSAPLCAVVGGGRTTNAWVLRQHDDELLLASDTPLAPNATLRLQLRLPLTTLALSANVVAEEHTAGGTRYRLRLVDPKDSERLALHSSAAVALSHWGPTTMVEIRAPITADTELKALAEHVRPHVLFDLSGVNRINSIGISRWIEGLGAIGPATESIHFVRASWAFVHSAALIPAVLGKGRLCSFFLPYTCGQCGLEREFLIEAAEVTEPLPPARFCDDCTARMEPALTAEELENVVSPPGAQRGT